MVNSLLATFDIAVSQGVRPCKIKGSEPPTSTSSDEIFDDMDTSDTLNWIIDKHLCSTFINIKT